MVEPPPTSGSRDRSAAKGDSLATALQVVTGMIAIPLIPLYLLILLGGSGDSGISVRWRNSPLNRGLIALSAVFIGLLAFRAMGGPATHSAESDRALVACIGGLMLVGGGLGAYYGNRLWAGFDSSALPASETNPGPGRIRLARTLGGAGAILLSVSLVAWVELCQAGVH